MVLLALLPAWTSAQVISCQGVTAYAAGPLQSTCLVRVSHQHSLQDICCSLTIHHQILKQQGRWSPQHHSWRCDISVATKFSQVEKQLRQWTHHHAKHLRNRSVQLARTARFFLKINIKCLILAVRRYSQGIFPNIFEHAFVRHHDCFSMLADYVALF